MSQLQQQGYHRQSLPKDWHLYSTEGKYHLVGCIKCYVEVCYFEALRYQIGINRKNKEIRICFLRMLSGSCLVIPTSTTSKICKFTFVLVKFTLDHFQ